MTSACLLEIYTSIKPNYSVFEVVADRVFPTNLMSMSDRNTVRLAQAFTSFCTHIDPGRQRPYLGPSNRAQCDVDTTYDQFGRLNVYVSSGSSSPLPFNLEGGILCCFSRTPQNSSTAIGSFVQAIADPL